MTSAPVQINECPTLNIAHHTHDYRKYFLLITLDDILHVGYNMIHIIILSSVCYIFYSTENILKYRGVSIFESTCQIYVLIEPRRRWCSMFHVRPPINSDRLWFSCQYQTDHTESRPLWLKWSMLLRPVRNTPTNQKAHYLANYNSSTYDHSFIIKLALKLLPVHEDMIPYIHIKKKLTIAVKVSKVMGLKFSAV